MISLKDIDKKEAESQLDPEILSAIKNIKKEWQLEHTISFTTSGSTGNAKHISFPKSAVQQSAEITAKAFELGPGSLCLCPLHPQYVAGKMMLLRAWHLDLDLWVCNPSNFTEALKNKSFHFVPLVPAQLESLLNLEEIIWPEKILLGGAPLSPSLRRSLGELRAPTSIYEGYGMTESLTHLALRQIHPYFEDYFQPLEPFSIEKSPENTLRFKAPHLGDSWINTTDLVAFNDAGGFKILGRADFIINSGGHKINPLEVEALLAELINNRYFIYGLPDEMLGEKAVLFIEGEEKQIDFEMLKSFLSQKTHPYNVPKAICYLPKFAKSPGGKTLRKETATRN
ncbi:MAG: AMP-binding protein [Luteibaculum sp.]